MKCTNYKDMSNFLQVSFGLLKIRTLFTFCFRRKSGFLKAGIHKILVRIANREDADQTASLESV